MNEYQESLSKLICADFKFCEENGLTPTSNEFNTLYELVDKATQKKPIILFSFEYLGVIPVKTIHVMGCPKCRMPIETYETETPRHCHMCGQAFDRGRND